MQVANAFPAFIFVKEVSHCFISVAELALSLFAFFFREIVKTHVNKLCETNK